ncbi:proton channel OTOP3-like [Heptranchias perlo]|uniref:proton channel OTOP3-like n=1 Tax=Heptranchias perlo TaxID=212740 RepID=UPI00355A20A3
MAERVEGETIVAGIQASLPKKLILENFTRGPENEGACKNPMAAEKSSKFLSGLLAVNVVFLGAAFVLSAIFNRMAVQGSHVLILLMTLSALTVGWMMYHQSAARSVLHFDLHAGAIWLRGAILLFGVCSVVLDVFKTGYHLQYKDGASLVKVVYPIVEAIFFSTQTYILWFHSKDCFHKHRNITRCGLMLTLATDLILWMSLITDDSIHTELQLDEQTTHNGSSTQLRGDVNITAHSCQSELCTVFRKGVVIMYPFNIEYCLISSTMLYIMWSNIGRTIDHHVTHANYKFRGQGIVLGPVLGLVVTVIGLCIFILYQIEVSADSSQSRPFVLFYVFHIVLLSIMSLCSLAGTAVHRWEEREVDTRENPTRRLDVVLLQVAALGQLCISYFSIVAVVSTHPERSVDRLNLTYSLFIIIEHVLQNLFIIEGLHRQHAAEELCLSSGGTCQKDPTIDPQNVNEQESLSLEQVHGVHEPTEATMDITTDGQDQLNDTDPPNGTTDSSSDLEMRRTSQLSLQTASKLNWKRKFLKEISIFMIMSNLVLWIMPAFGAHPQLENGLEKRFYGFSVWFAILNFGLPLGVFYRMHSAGNLLEIYLTA